MSTQVQSLRLMLDYNYSAMQLQAGRIVRSILSSKHVMSVCVDANITGTFHKFFEVHYKLLHRILQNFNARGLLSVHHSDSVLKHFSFTCQCCGLHMPSFSFFLLLYPVYDFIINIYPDLVIWFASCFFNCGPSDNSCYLCHTKNPDDDDDANGCTTSCWYRMV